MRVHSPRNCDCYEKRELKTTGLRGHADRQDDLARDGDCDTRWVVDVNRITNTGNLKDITQRFSSSRCNGYKLPIDAAR